MASCYAKRVITTNVKLYCLLYLFSCLVQLYNSAVSFLVDFVPMNHGILDVEVAS